MKFNHLLIHPCFTALSRLVPLGGTSMIFAVSLAVAGPASNLEIPGAISCHRQLELSVHASIPSNQVIDLYREGWMAIPAQLRKKKGALIFSKDNPRQGSFVENMSPTEHGFFMEYFIAPNEYETNHTIEDDFKGGSPVSDSSAHAQLAQYLIKRMNKMEACLDKKIDCRVDSEKISTQDEDPTRAFKKALKGAQTDSRANFHDVTVNHEIMYITQASFLDALTACKDLIKGDDTLVGRINALHLKFKRIVSGGTISPSLSPSEIGIPPQPAALDSR